jgi:putative ABC transport system permease protein
MFGRILKKDISRNKVITATLFLFILLAAMLVSGAVNIIITLFGSMDSLFIQSKAPHYVQMHSGEIDQSAIDAFSANNPLVESQQTVTMLGINGAYIYLGNNQDSEADSIIENSFVVQNKYFYFLFDTES